MTWTFPNAAPVQMSIPVRYAKHPTFRFEVNSQQALSWVWQIHHPNGLNLINIDNVVVTKVGDL